MDDLIPIASSVERPSLERLEKYLSHHGLACVLRQGNEPSEKFQLMVAKADFDSAQQVLAEIAFIDRESSAADDVVEIRFDGTERIEVASWLQELLDEKDQEGSPIFFYREDYEAFLDGLHTDGQVEIAIYLIKGLKGFIPTGAKRMQMGQGLQEFFTLIEAVTEGEG